MSDLEPVDLTPENILYYQENPCEFSLFEILNQHSNNIEIQIRYEQGGEVECFGKNTWVEYQPAKLIENGWDEFENEKINIWIGTNFSIDLLLQSFIWLILLSFIPKGAKYSLNKVKSSSFVIAVLFYLHLVGEKSYYSLFSRQYDTAFISREFNGDYFFENYYLYIYTISILLIVYIFNSILKYRYKNLINYLPYVFLIFGTFTSLNINFYILIFSFLGINVILKKEFNVSLLIIYSLFVFFWIKNLNQLEIYFDVDKVRGFVNSSQSLTSTIFWVGVFFLFYLGINSLIKSTTPEINIELLRRNFLISGSLIYIIGISSASNKLVNFFSLYFLGLNKFGMSSLESIEGNTWRGIAPSAEGMGEFFGFVILFSLMTYFYFKKKLNYFDLLLLVLNILGLARTNNFAAIVSMSLVFFVFLVNSRIKSNQSKFLIYTAVLTLSVLSYYLFLNEFSFQFLSSIMYFEGVQASEIYFQFVENEFGLNDAEKGNYQFLLEIPKEQRNLSTSLNFLIDQYTYGGNIKYLPHYTSLLSFVSYFINRSQKWGVFFAKYDPSLEEFLFGYGPQQLTDYYFGHATKYNFGLELPHSSLFNYLIFFGIFGILILSFFTLKFLFKNYQKGIANYFLIYLLLNFFKSDALLYVPNFILLIFVLNFYRYVGVSEKKDSEPKIYRNNFDFSINKIVNNIFHSINYKLSTLSIFVSLFVFMLLNTIHSDRLKILIDASVGVVDGNPGWIAFQNRLMGPYMLKFLINNGLTEELSVIIFVVFFVVINNLLFTHLLFKITNNQKITISYILLFNALFVLTQHPWLYAWDFIDILFYIFYGYFIFINKISFPLVILNFLHIFNRETALIMAIVFIIIIFLEKQAPSNSIFQRKIIFGLIFNFIFGVIYTYYSRKTLFIEKAYFTQGIEAEGSVLGGNWLTLGRFNDYFFTGELSRVSINALILLTTVFFLQYVVRNFKIFNLELKAFSIAIVANLGPIFIFGDFTETRLYFSIFVLLVFFLRANNKNVSYKNT